MLPNLLLPWYGPHRNTETLTGTDTFVASASHFLQPVLKSQAWLRRYILATGPCEV